MTEKQEVFVEWTEVSLILEKLAASETMEQLLEAHPRLTPEAIRAALAFTAWAFRVDIA